MRVGRLTIDPPTILAPMSEVSDLALRTVCEELGVGLTVTEFLSADALEHGAEKTLGKLAPSLGGRPFCVQIFGRSPEVMARAALQGVAAGAALVDINMGCPARRVVSGSAGAALMKEPALAQAIVRAVRAALPREMPLSVKHRAGWDETHLDAPGFAVAMVEAGAEMITVHGRTRAQGFRGCSSLDLIRRVRQALPARIPLVGNGDVQTLEDYRRMREETGCEGVMIGRGALGNPWLFRAIAARERGEALPAPPSHEEKQLLVEHHLDLVEVHARRQRLPHELRKVIAWYSKGLRGSAALRHQMLQDDSAEGIRRLARDFFSRPAEGISREEVIEERLLRLKAEHAWYAQRRT